MSDFFANPRPRCWHCHRTEHSPGLKKGGTECYSNNAIPKTLPQNPPAQTIVEAAQEPAEMPADEKRAVFSAAADWLAAVKKVKGWFVNCRRKSV